MKNRFFLEREGAESKKSRGGGVWAVSNRFLGSLHGFKLKDSRFRSTTVLYCVDRGSSIEGTAMTHHPLSSVAAPVSGVRAEVKIEDVGISAELHTGL